MRSSDTAATKHAMRLIGATLGWHAPAQALCIPIWKEWVHHAKQYTGKSGCIMQAAGRASFTLPR